MTNAQLVLEKIKSTLCHEGTSYKGRSGTYKFVVGKTTAEGTINGVVKKMNEAGEEKTAGSFKILEDGTVTRFTGIATKVTKDITSSIQSETSSTSVDQSVEQESNQEEAIAI